MAGYVSNGIAIDYHDGEGRAKIKGVRWMWEFHEYTGPHFYYFRKRDRQWIDAYPEPGDEKQLRHGGWQWVGCHPVWNAFAKWYRRYEPRHKAAQSHEIVTV